MISLLVSMAIMLATYNIVANSTVDQPRVKIMTLGVFHFDYPNLDVVKVAEADQISVLDEPFQSEIRSLVEALKEFAPDYIAVEWTVDRQARTDSLYNAYRNGKFELGRNEVFQLGFRTASQMNHVKVFCVDDPGVHYPHIESMFTDQVRIKQYLDYYNSSPDTIYTDHRSARISSILDALLESNHSSKVNESLGSYLVRGFKYEEDTGDFFGVDFESGRWFNRNLRIFRNIQRIQPLPGEKILLIIGSGHLNLLNHFFEVSPEFELVSPIPYLERAKTPIE